MARNPTIICQKFNTNLNTWIFNAPKAGGGGREAEEARLPQGPVKAEKSYQRPEAKSKGIEGALRKRQLRRHR